MKKKKVFPTESGRSLWAANSTPAVRLDYVSACIIIDIFVGQANFICSHKSQWTLDLEISWESGVSLTRYADSVLINGSTWYLTNQHSNQGTGKFRKGLECRVGEEREREKGDSEGGLLVLGSDHLSSENSVWSLECRLYCFYIVSYWTLMTLCRKILPTCEARQVEVAEREVSHSFVAWWVHGLDHWVNLAVQGLVSS